MNNMQQASDAPLSPSLQARLLTRGTGARRLGKDDVIRATEILSRYKAGKANLENRIVQDELWWELRHWEVIRRASPNGERGNAPRPEPTSAWLFNAILNKHADAMDNFPSPVVLPRERSDEESARTLSDILPVVLECCEYEQTYSDNWWEKLKHGTAAYGVFWNAQKENGLGDVDIRQIDLLKLFWEPGVTDLQKSRNLFIVELADEDLLERQYPEHRGKLSGKSVDVRQYIHDDSIDISHKRVVVDWYYKLRAPSGRTVLHYAKFVGEELLYASENDPLYQDRGFYDHGLYPVVLDVLFPEKGTPVGFGYVAICKDPQLYIDRLSANILESSMMNTKKRFFVSDSTAVNEEEFLDWNRPLVHVAGALDDSRIREIVCRPLDGIYLNVVQMKIDEMKDTAANRDVNSGGAHGGVTAAAAIAALQEAGNKASRDMISASYRACIGISSLCIELIRQFYDETRAFRIAGASPGSYRFVEFNNRGIADQTIGESADGGVLVRRPVFDLKIRAQRRNPFSRMEENQRAKELYALGFFNPERAQEALGALEMMDFEGIDTVREQIRRGQSLLSVCRQLRAQLDAAREIIQSLSGARAAERTAAEDITPPAPERTHATGTDSGSGADRFAAAVLRAKTPSPAYGQRLMQRTLRGAEAKEEQA